MNRFSSLLQKHTGSEQLAALDLTSIQVNIGLACNLSCEHCHVGAGPTRREQMSWSVMESVINWAVQSGCKQVDITGGAPEMHPRLMDFVDALRARSIAVQVRTNLSIHMELAYQSIAPMLRERGVDLVGSMPCYLQENVDKQRGEGTYGASIAALKRLNSLGFGIEGGGILNLVYNPGGAFLPPAQGQLEVDYKKRLMDDHGVSFSHLLTITNLPIGRFRADLRRQGKEESYLVTLEEAFNPATLDGLMCRHQVSVRWDGMLFDCDFNLALNQSIEHASGRSVGEFEVRSLPDRRVWIDDHCLGCTAGAGSSCGGVLA
uniref:Putative Fe-S oxidoreductase. Radical SAM domain protein n=1 Tax=Magnetococcus massalia (strain MO-1) TaxID=451514 RepID=A0A1S7LNY4_MAGMO|nr:Putative Fe-S oxidoreductase. Radical SAM domain protein [Candidatus Magnetococcus massalia]